MKHLLKANKYEEILSRTQFLQPTEAIEYYRFRAFLGLQDYAQAQNLFSRVKTSRFGSGEGANKHVLLFAAVLQHMSGDETVAENILKQAIVIQLRGSNKDSIVKGWVTHAVAAVAMKAPESGYWLLRTGYEIDHAEGARGFLTGQMKNRACDAMAMMAASGIGTEQFRQDIVTQKIPDRYNRVMEQYKESGTLATDIEMRFRGKGKG